MFKLTTLLLIAIFSTSCATTGSRLQLTCDGTCALSGMTCVSETHGAIDHGWYYGKSRATSVQCEKPKNEQEEKEIKELVQEIEAKKQEHREKSSISTKDVILGGVVVVGLVVVSAIVNAVKKK